MRSSEPLYQNLMEKFQTWNHDVGSNLGIMKEWLFVELNFVPDTLHGIGSSIKQTEINNDNTRKTENVTKTTVNVVVRIIVTTLRIIIIIVIIVNY